jgi:hypothetical protein
MFRYLMVAVFCVALVKTTVRIAHYANPTGFKAFSSLPRT